MRSFIALRCVALLSIAHALPAPSYFDGYASVDDATTPLQVRLAYQGPTAMMVSWNTFAQLDQPRVHYGFDSDSLYFEAASHTSFIYPSSLTYINHVNLTNLLPDTTYYYLPDSSNSSITPFTFKTAKPAGCSDPFSVAIVVDMGTFGPLGLSNTTGAGASHPLQTAEQTTIQSLVSARDSFDFVLHPGDLAYADAWLKEEIQGYLPNTTKDHNPAVYEAINNAFYDELMDVSAYKPYMVSPGNHEANCDNGGTKDKATGIKYTTSICPAGQLNFTGFRNRFRMPSAVSGGLENFWYSFDYGMAHFVSIDTETDLGHGLAGPSEGSPEFSGPFGLRDQQLAWLRNDLANVDRQKTPWVIVTGHRPFYNSGGGICANCTAVFEPIFHEFGVDLYFTGHSHIYNRNAPIYQNVVDPNELNNPNATWHIVNGAAGHYDGLDTLTYPLMPYTRYAQDQAYSWSKLIFHNCTHLTQQAIYSMNGSVYDEATLFKDRVCAQDFP